VARSETRHAALRRNLAVAENIADSTKGFDERRLAFTIDFTPKAVDMNIDNVGIGVDAHAPNFIENHGAGDDATWIAAEIFKEGELLRREIEGLTVAKSLATKQVHLKIEDAKPSGFGGQGTPLGEIA
jgi:hypothetical protein